jgi:2-haloacid dehalogenase
MVRALFFDVFGTVVDWRNGVAREARRILAPQGIEIDWLAFADAWRACYQPSMEKVRSGSEPYANLDVIHRANLELIRERFGLDRLDEATLAELTLAWHKLDAWDDAKRAFPRLHRRFLMAPVSNGNIALMVDIARHNGIVWDAILGAEIARDFKPKPRVYLSAAAAFALSPEECMMVAAHSADLRAAKETGLMTAFVARPSEAPGKESAPSTPMDVVANSFDELAEKLEG